MRLLAQTALASAVGDAEHLCIRLRFQRIDSRRVVTLPLSVLRNIGTGSGVAVQAA